MALHIMHYSMHIFLRVGVGEARDYGGRRVAVALRVLGGGTLLYGVGGHRLALLPRVILGDLSMRLLSP